MRRTKLVLGRMPGIREARLGVFVRARPASHYFGFDRGYCVDRYYIDRFLSRNKSAIRGTVLEVGDDAYTRKFGNEIERREILHRTGENPDATLVGDVTQAGTLPQATFDCIVCTQTLQFIYDFRAALEHLHDALKPGGTLLATFPGISQLSRDDVVRYGEYWRFTKMGAQLLFSEVFGPQSVSVEAPGNLLASVALLSGLTVEDVGTGKLELDDPEFELIVLVRADKGAETS